MKILKNAFLSLLFFLAASSFLQAAHSLTSSADSSSLVKLFKDAAKPSREDLAGNWLCTFKDISTSPQSSFDFFLQIGFFDTLSSQWPTKINYPQNLKNKSPIFAIPSAITWKLQEAEALAMAGIYCNSSIEYNWQNTYYMNFRISNKNIIAELRDWDNTRIENGYSQIDPKVSLGGFVVCAPYEKNSSCILF